MTDDDSSDSPDADALAVELGLTSEMYALWRTPRFGSSNPARMNNPVWEWLVRSRISAYGANQKFDGPSATYVGPGWCFQRMGQSTTSLSDGRVVMIAGEHEDHYDPDFYIYNDVVVAHPDGTIDILGYPVDVFPPTDFHSATLVGNRIIIVGSLGYPDHRRPGETPVWVLDLGTMAISSVRTAGKPPGWLHEHEAVLEDSGDTILIRRGKLDRGGNDASHVENIDDWRLHLEDWRWERVTERRWQRWEIIRHDRKPNHLWEIQQAVWYRSVDWKKELKEQMQELTENLGLTPDLDLAEQIFSPTIPHEKVSEEQSEHNVDRIRVGDVLVRYVRGTYSIQVTVEGQLPQTTIESLKLDLSGKMQKLEGALFDLKVIS